MPTILNPLPLPSEQEVMASTTSEVFSLDNWRKHFSAGEPYAHFEEFASFDGCPLTRADVFRKFADGDEPGILATLKWGYPNGAQRQSYRAFSRLVWALGDFAGKLQQLRNGPPRTATEVLAALNEDGIGTATTSKIAYFAGLQAVEGRCLIYDSMVRRAIRRLRDGEFEQLRAVLSGPKGDISPSQQLASYGLYLTATNAAAARHEVSPEQLELFLFRLGRAYSFPPPGGPAREMSMTCADGLGSAP